MDEFDEFYTAFEDRFRGSFEEIKARLADYLPELEKIRDSKSPSPVLDLGSGRGEWLQLLKENGIEAVGVDQNPYSAARGTDRGLNIAVGDIFEVMFAKPPASYSAITAFHVIEHLPWKLQLKLFQEANRLLMPGGVLILEWPNVENIKVATSSFWLDPTHLRPIPVPLASFMAEYVGFVNIRTLRFRPNWTQSPGKTDLLKQRNGKLGLWDRLLGRKQSTKCMAGDTKVSAELAELLSPGQDVAIIASKPADTGISIEST